ncbi:MAG: SixA phosphatase family protein [Ilumatobacteraceae bacterium]
MTVRLVVLRHASAGKRNEWTDDDTHRPLDRLGTDQADVLVDVFADVPLQRILTSRYVRCRETVAALAAARGTQSVDEGWLAEGSALDEVAAGLRGIGSDTLVCTHGDIVELIGTCLAIEPDLRHLPKAGAWVIELVDGHMVDLALLAAPEPATGDQPLHS